MQGPLPRFSPVALVLVALLAGLAWAAQKPFATVESNDGTQYYFYRTSSPITASAASAACAAAGTTLASFTSADQVLSTLWSPDVVEAAADETALLWTGLKITWPTATATATSHHRRSLRSTHLTHHPDRQPDANELTLLERLATEMDSSTDFVVPTHTQDGRRRLPQLVRLWLYQQHRLSSGSRRAILGRDGTSPYLDDAKLRWADGSDTSFVLSNPTNMGFLACNRKKVAECCGAVFDIGPDPYPGTDFPTIFFYPCGAEKLSGVTPPAGFVCAAAPPVAELPRSSGVAQPNKHPSLSPSPSPSQSAAPAAKKCNPGSAPAAKAGAHPCVRCKPNMFSDDGTRCKKCPAGTQSAKGAVACS